MERESTDKTTKVKATTVKIPSKVIISGEHFVIHTKKAIACAIDVYTTISINETQNHNNIEIISDKINYHNILERSQIGKLCDEIIGNNNNNNNHNNTNNSSGTEENLVILAIGKMLSISKTSDNNINNRHNINNDNNIGLQIKIETENIYSGLGSSASIILGIIYVFNEYFNLRLPQDEIESIAINLEHYQHGKSSGIDIRTIINGGVNLFDNSAVSQLNTGIIDDIVIINTGTPKYKTKNVVNMTKDILVHKFIHNESKNENEYMNIIDNILQSLKENANEKLQKLITHNQQLLHNINISSTKVNNFINELQSNSISAKISGAGTIGNLDDNCGVVAIFDNNIHSKINILDTVCNKYNYKYKFCKIDKHGIRYC